MPEKNLKITLVKSSYNRIPEHAAVLNDLRLRKIGKSVVRKDHPTVRGKIRKISYLVKVEEV